MPEATSSVRSEGSRSSRTLLVAFVLAMAVGAVFSPTRHHDFLDRWDDDAYILDNPMVQGGLSAQGWVAAWTEFRTANWHPLTWLSHMLDVELYGLAPGGHHLTNVILHAAATVLLFLALFQMTGAVWRSAFVAALFGLHPLRLESVAWVSERKDVLSGVFWMLTLLAYAAYVRRPGVGRYLAVVASFALGLLSKPMLVTLPFVLLLLDYWPLQRTPLLERSESDASGSERPAPGPGWRRLLLEKLPLLLLAAASCGVTLVAQRPAVRSLESFPFAVRVGNAAVSYLRYLEMLVWPAKLATIYPHPGAELSGVRIALAVGVLLAISLVAVHVRRRQPWALTGWLWYLGTLVPVIGLVQVGAQSHADRYTYLPSIGILLALTWAVPAFPPQRAWARRTLAVTAAVLIGCAALTTARLLPHWKNSRTLFERAIAVTQNNGVAERNLGILLWKEARRDGKPGLLRDAERHLREALRIDPKDVPAMEGLGAALQDQPGIAPQREGLAWLRRAVAAEPDRVPSLVILGLLLIRFDQLDEAERHLERALALEGGKHAAALQFLGDLRTRRGDFVRAIASYRAALDLAPNSYDTHNNLARAYQQNGELEQARSHYETALRLAPENPGVLSNLGVLCVQQGRPEEGLRFYERALRHTPEPDRPRVLFKMAEANVLLGDYDRALELYASVARSRPRDPDALLELGRTQLQLGRIEEARHSLERVLKLAPGHQEAKRLLAELPTSDRPRG